MSSSKQFTDMGWPEEDCLWTYTLLTEPLLSSELARLSGSQTLGDTDFVSFQPCPNPEQLSQDRFVIQDWSLPSGTWAFRAVFDGHAGHETADYVANALPKMVQESLILAISAADGKALSSEEVSQILAENISSFDNQLTEDVLRIFPSPEAIAALSDDEINTIINDTDLGGKNLTAIMRCMRGSTVLVTLTDATKSNLWVASLGDCQAVLGIRNTSNEWEAYILSSNHNGVNPAEVSRIQTEHPGEPECILDNRVLGAIAVTRAVGDHLFKLPSIYTRRVFSQARHGFLFSTRIDDFLPRNQTPPYLSNVPDVRHIHLTAEAKEKRLIICTDGLMDLYEHRYTELSSMAEKWFKVISGQQENAALSLLRDGLGGEDESIISRMMTVEMTSRWMDDTTILIQHL